MLLQFNFSNFRSFRDSATLDLSATKITEHANHVRNIGNEKILQFAGIYGANASGKSNVIAAFDFMSSFVFSSFGYGGTSGNNMEEDIYERPSPFLFDLSSRTQPSTFEVYFVDAKQGEKTINYGFALDDEGVKEEWLNTRSKSNRGNFRRIFYRQRGEAIDLSGLPKRAKENLSIALEEEALIVSLGAKLKVQILASVYDWFRRNAMVDFGDPIRNFLESRRLPAGFIEKPEVRSAVVKYFSTFDPSITDFKVTVTERGESESRPRVEIDAVHKMADNQGEAFIPLEEESSGTLKMFALFPLLQRVLDMGSVLFVDELNSRLHPLLLRNVMLLFANLESNPHGAQLVFTSHDTWQLNNGMLRRDEIWFTEKSQQGISSLYSLADFVDETGSKIRKDENYEKNYLLGKYGAIPDLEAIEFLDGGAHAIK